MSKKEKVYHGVKGERIISNSASYEVNKKRDFIESMLLYGAMLIFITGIIIWLM